MAAKAKAGTVTPAKAPTKAAAPAAAPTKKPLAAAELAKEKAALEELRKKEQKAKEAVKAPVPAKAPAAPAPSAPPAEPKKRGRPPGSKNKEKVVEAPAEEAPTEEVPAQQPRKVGKLGTPWDKGGAPAAAPAEAENPAEEEEPAQEEEAPSEESTEQAADDQGEQGQEQGEEEAPVEEEQQEEEAPAEAAVNEEEAPAEEPAVEEELPTEINGESAEDSSLSDNNGSRSSFTPGEGSKRINTRFIALYGPPKSRKTTSASFLRGAKWIISDSNAIPTLATQGRLPPAGDIYERKTVAEAHQLVNDMIDFVIANPDSHGITAVICDSATAWKDQHERDISEATSQSYMGENEKDNGWQQFNTTFGNFLDALAELSRYVTVVVICHAKEKAQGGKGEFSGLNLPPQMALKMGRLANWVLLQSIRSYTMTAEETAEENEFITLAKNADGSTRVVEVIIHTQPVGQWTASANAINLQAEEPANLATILAKEGLYTEPE